MQHGKSKILTERRGADSKAKESTPYSKEIAGLGVQMLSRGLREVEEMQAGECSKKWHQVVIGMESFLKKALERALNDERNIRPDSTNILKVVQNQTHTSTQGFTGLF